MKDSILADSFEAILGAIFLDGGYGAARKAVVQAFGPLLDSLDPGNVEKDPKTRLQELMHARGKAVPQYQVVATHGAPHQRTFEVECVVDEARTRGEGTSRQRAEQEAARAMLARLEQ
jgi:ribonuclease-3